MNGLLLVIQTISDFLWGTPMTIALIGTGLYQLNLSFATSQRLNFISRIHLERCSKGKEKGKEPYLDSQQHVQLWPIRSVLGTSVVWQLRSRWEDQERSSGCGSQHFSECLQKPVRSFLDRDIV